MKKNLLIAVLLLLTVSSVWAKDYNVETKKFKSWGEAQFDAETATITFTKNWQGGGWWLSRLDCSAYDCIVIEFEEALPMDVMFMATYSAKDDKDQKIKSKVKVPAGKKKAVLELEPAYKNSVDGLGISATKAGVVKLKSLNLKEHNKNTRGQWQGHKSFPQKWLLPISRHKVPLRCTSIPVKLSVESVSSVFLL